MKTQKIVQENEELKAHIREKEREISSLREKNQLLEEQVKLLQALHFGPQTERFTSEDKRQERLFNEAEDEAFKQTSKEQTAFVRDTVEIGPYVRRKRRNQGRKAISADLPREEIVYDIPEEEKVCGCGNELTCIGEEVSERVAIKPVEVKVLREKKSKMRYITLKIRAIVSLD